MGGTAAHQALPAHYIYGMCLTELLAPHGLRGRWAHTLFILACYLHNILECSDPKE